MSITSLHVADGASCHQAEADAEDSPREIGGPLTCNIFTMQPNERISRKRRRAWA